MSCHIGHVYTSRQELTSPVAVIRNNFQIYMMSSISQCAHTVHPEKGVFFLPKLNLFSQIQLHLQLSSEYPALSVRAVK